MMNTASAGGAQAKTGVWACALDRHVGFTKTEKAMSSKTRSRHTGGSMNNKWKDVGGGLGGNVVGYSPGGGHGHMKGGY